MLAKVFPLKPAQFYKPFAGLGSKNKTATSLHLLSDSRSVLIILSSPTSSTSNSLAGTVFNDGANFPTVYSVFDSNK